jgi:hypothetical protein
MRRLSRAVREPLAFASIVTGLTLTWTGHGSGFPFLSVGIVMALGPDSVRYARRQVLWIRERLPPRA